MTTVATIPVSVRRYVYTISTFFININQLSYIEQYFKANYAIVEALTAIAQRKNITPAQLCIAWVGSLGDKVIPLPGSSYVLSFVITISKKLTQKPLFIVTLNVL